MSRRPVLAELLGDARHNGLYRLPEDAEVAVAIPIPGRKLTGKRAMLDVLSEALAFPDYFDANWDALEECLSDLAWLEGDVALVIADAETPESKAPEAWGVLLDILADAARFWKSQGRSFVVFLRGGHAAYPLVSA